jgi:hypothetical protein
MYCYLQSLSAEARRLAVAAAFLSVVAQVLLIGTLFDALPAGTIV